MLPIEIGEKTPRKHEEQMSCGREFIGKFGHWASRRQGCWRRGAQHSCQSTRFDIRVCRSNQIAPRVAHGLAGTLVE